MGFFGTEGEGSLYRQQIDEIKKKIQEKSSKFGASKFDEVKKEEVKEEVKVEVGVKKIGFFNTRKLGSANVTTSRFSTTNLGSSNLDAPEDDFFSSSSSQASLHEATKKTPVSSATPEDKTVIKPVAAPVATTTDTTPTTPPAPKPAPPLPARPKPNTNKDNVVNVSTSVPVAEETKVTSAAVLFKEPELPETSSHDKKPRDAGKEESTDDDEEDMSEGTEDEGEDLEAMPESALRSAPTPSTSANPTPSSKSSGKPTKHSGSKSQPHHNYTPVPQGSNNSTHGNLRKTLGNIFSEIKISCEKKELPRESLMTLSNNICESLLKTEKLLFVNKEKILFAALFIKLLLADEASRLLNPKEKLEFIKNFKNLIEEIEKNLIKKIHQECTKEDEEKNKKKKYLLL